MAAVTIGVLAIITGIVSFVSINAWLGLFLILLGVVTIASGLRRPFRQSLR
jgi:hypothetical protein